MKELFENAPKIISEASRNPLGICALFILAVTLLGWLFFDAASDWLKASMFLVIVTCFLVIAKISFAYSKDIKANGESGAIDHESSGHIENTEIEIVDQLEWSPITNKDEKYTLSAPEADILESLRGKPDVHWSNDVLISAAKSKSQCGERELVLAIGSLVKKRYLLIRNQNKFEILPLAIDYYRATANNLVHDIDEADYWDGT